MADETFGERLKRLRIEKGLTHTQLAYRVGLTEGAIRQMESGAIKTATFPVGMKIAKVLKVNPSYLALGEGKVTLPADEADAAARHSQNEESLALGGLSLAQEVRALRERMEALEAWRRTYEEPTKKRARR